MQTRCFTILVVGSLLVTAATAIRAGEGGNRDFDREVAPLLARRCLDCHSGPDPKAASTFRSGTRRRGRQERQGDRSGKARREPALGAGRGRRDAAVIAA